MSEKRRDSRNRILRNGESQRSDGRYMFKYVDGYGEVRYVYSWRLDKNDRTPAGRHMEHQGSGGDLCHMGREVETVFWCKKILELFRQD